MAFRLYDEIRSRTPASGPTFWDYWRRKANFSMARFAGDQNPMRSAAAVAMWFRDAPEPPEAMSREFLEINWPKYLAWRDQRGKKR